MYAAVTKGAVPLPALCATIACQSVHRNEPPEVVGTIVPVAESLYGRMRKISEQQGIPIPEEFDHLMQAARSADWPAVSNQYEQIRKKSHWYAHDEPNDPRFVTQLFHPLHETYWTFNYLRAWPPELVEEYCEMVLSDLPFNSILFTGSDSSRFLIGSLAEQRGRGDIAFISQNALADFSYEEYLRSIYGERIRIPSDEELTAAFSRYVEQVNKEHPADGSVSVGDASDVMRINGFIAKNIVEENRATSRIFVEEAYVIPWMLPYLKPHGLVMELMPEPVTTISAQEVQQDAQLWRDLELHLSATYKISANEWSGMAYALMRSAIAGVYAEREMYNEAEAAFRQAMRLAPNYPSSAFRLAVQVLAPQGRVEEAVVLLQDLEKAHPENKEYRKYIERLSKR